VLAVLTPWAALAGFGVYVLCLVLFRVSSIGSLVGGLTAVGVSAAMSTPLPYVATAAALFVLMLWTHRSNIRRLLRREERRVL
jgi:glycerol-3-phosphate acyltransferase PlsY